MKVVFETIKGQKVGKWALRSIDGTDLPIRVFDLIVLGGKRFSVVGSRAAFRPGDDPYSMVFLVDEVSKASA